ncbi:MAG: hypothetical protein HFJ50_06335 [Clostridia bacterium]|jgi:flagellar basal body-associated protein FliL|nr:hypothetical protein [Clostridia bacterium]
MKRREEGKGIAIIIIAIVVILIVALGMGALFVLNNHSQLKKEIITAENYDEIIAKLDKELEGQDDLYYISYSVMYHIMQDGMASALEDEENQNAIYASIYGKSVQELIDEGKDMMQKNGVTVEQFKTELNKVSNQTIEN